MKQIILFLGVIGTVLFGFSPQAHAQAVSLTLSPQHQTIAAQPGAIIPLTYTIENAGDPVIIQLRTVAFEQIGNNAQLQPRPDKPTPVQVTSITPEYALDEPFLTTTDQSVSITVQIQVPQDYEETDTIIGVLAETTPPQLPDGQVAIGVSGQVVSSILLQVTSDGRFESDYQVPLFDVRPQYEIPFGGKPMAVFDMNTPVPVIAYVHNGAQHTVEITGVLTHIGPFGNRMTYELSSAYVFPSTQRLLTTADSDNTHILHNLSPGQHKLTATIQDTEASTITTKQVSFVVIPILLTSVVAGILVVLVVLAVLAVVHRRRIEAYLIQKRRQKRRVSLLD